MPTLLALCFAVAAGTTYCRADEADTAEVANKQANDDRPVVVVVIGAAGTPPYGREFADWAANWKTAADRGAARLLQIGADSSGGGNSGSELNDRERLRTVLETLSGESHHELWLVLIGHGTFDGRAARFNLRGSDVTADELAGWLGPVKRPLAVINCASSSGPFIHALSAENRVVITAAKSGFEQNYARFGKYLSAAITEPQADLDKDGQTSLLEAWLRASRDVEEFYRAQGRLATEHSLLEDNGDRLAVKADFFRGVRAVKRPEGEAAVDGHRAHQFHLVRSREEEKLPPEQRRRRDELELSVIRLRERKSDLHADEYYARLETLLLELAEIYEEATSGETGKDGVVPASATAPDNATSGLK